MYDPSEFALTDFQNVCLTSLNSFGTLKKKYVRVNQASFMSLKRQSWLGQNQGINFWKVGLKKTEKHITIQSQKYVG